LYDLFIATLVATGGVVCVIITLLYLRGHGRFMLYILDVITALIFKPNKKSVPPVCTKCDMEDDDTQV
jgi:hypothetical protein